MNLAIAISIASQGFEKAIATDPLATKVKKSGFKR
jgi:hypothetical protein